MKVLFIAGKETEGGAVRSLIEMITEEKNMGIDPIVCTSLKDQLNQKLDRLGIVNYPVGFDSAMNPVSPYKWKRPLKKPYEIVKYYMSIPQALGKLDTLIDWKSIDIIHTNAARNDLGCYLNKKYGIPHIMHIREFGQEDFSCTISHPDYYNFLNKYTTKFIAISNAVKESWVRKGLDENKIEVVYNGINASEIAPSNHDSRRIRLVMVGGICEAKGQFEAIKAVCQLFSKGMDVSLDLIGWSDPKYEELLKEYVERQHATSVIRFLGAHKTVYSILKNYDIGLMCSKSEGFGRVTAEYMFAGLGVIASNTGANPEIVIPKKNGLLYQRGDIEDLVKQICMLAENRGLLNSLSENAILWARSNYTIHQNVDNVINVYNKVLSRQKHSAYHI